MRSFLMIFLACFSFSLSPAQTPAIIYSSPFPEPEGLESKIVQCRNGNTFLFVFTKKDGIKTTVFNKERKITAKKTYEGKKWENREMLKSRVNGIYEINNELVLFLEQTSGRTPSLFRLVINPENGALKKEEKIAEMPKYGAGAGYAMAFGNVNPKSFYVIKDPASDAYAVISFDGFAKETAQRIQITHYNGEHQIISQSFYDSPETRFKYINYIGATVDGEKQVFLAAYGYNTAASGGKDSRVILSKLRAGSNMMLHNALSSTANFKETKAILVYNEGNHVLQLLTLSLEKTKGNGFMSNSATSYYTVLISAIDPETLSILYSKPVLAQKASEYKKLHYNGKKDYQGMPMDFVVHKDNSASLLLEEITTVSNSRGSLMSYMGDIGILDLDERGIEQEGYVIQKEQQTRIGIAPLSMHDKIHNKVVLERMPGIGYANPGFYSYDYISTEAGRYVIFNDLRENFERDERSNPRTLGAISGANTVCYKLSNGKSEKFYLFGAPRSKEEARFAFISSSSSLDNSYATLMIEKTGKNKMARIAWVSFP